MTAQIIIEDRPPIWLTGPQYVIGRGEECDVLLPENDGTASRRHALLERDNEGSWWLADQGSTNGTSVNGQRLSQRFQLNDRDKIAIGQSRIVFIQPRSQPTMQVPTDVSQAATRPQPESAREIPPLPPPQPVARPGGAAGAGPGRGSYAPPPPPPPSSQPHQEAQAFDPTKVMQKASQIVTAASQGDCESVVKTVTIIAGGAMILSLFMAWAQVSFFGMRAGMTYMKLCQMALEEGQKNSGMFVDAISKEPSLLALLLPPIAIINILSALAVTKQIRTQAGNLLSGGLIGLLGCGVIYYKLTGDTVVDLSGLLGPGFKLFVFASLVSAATGLWATLTLQRNSSQEYKRQ